MFYNTLYNTATCIADAAGKYEPECYQWVIFVYTHTMYSYL